MRIHVDARPSGLLQQRLQVCEVVSGDEHSMPLGGRVVDRRGRRHAEAGRVRTVKSSHRLDVSRTYVHRSCHQRAYVDALPRKHVVRAMNAGVHVLRLDTRL